MKPLNGVLSACFFVCSACDKGAAPSPASSAPQTAQAPAEPSKLLAPGAAAPDLVMRAHTGETVQLSKLRGQPVVVYFYPKDDTPGCTVEAQELRDLSAELGRQKAIVLGVSTDDEESHKAFAEKHQLPFLLLVDRDHAIARAFGVPIVNGRAKRISFVIDKGGKVARVFTDVTPKGHGQELLQTVGALQS
ncbi:MAG TPA: peroxiredoxin [Polyangiaceae bacterium]